MNAPVKQHLIDPGICIRCNTCEATCPVGAVTHDANNYVVDPAICNFCMDCVSPCPTGSINHFVLVSTPFSLDEQFSWTELPQHDEATAAPADGTGSIEAVDEEVAALLADAHKGTGGRVRAPDSASAPRINLYGRQSAAQATVAGNFRLTAEGASSDVRHVILEHRHHRAGHRPGRPAARAATLFGGESA